MNHDAGQPLKTNDPQSCDAKDVDLQRRIERIRKNKSSFKTPSAVQGLGTTWENWVSSGIGLGFPESNLPT